jgi:hypothetical protein
MGASGKSSVASTTVRGPTPTPTPTLTLTLTLSSPSG